MTPSERPVCLITGSASGIGASCATFFARSGWDVGICYLDDATRTDAESVAGACTALGARTFVQMLNVTRYDDCVRVATDTAAHFGRLDALLNCAGTTRFIRHADLDALNADEFTRTYDVNVIGTYNMTKACTDALRRSGRGSVVNISSIAGLHGVGSSVAYAASKGAVNTLTLSLARALSPQIRVNAIAPGYVAGGLPSRVLDAASLEKVEATYMRTQALPRLLQTEEVAALAFFLIAHAPGMTGEIVRLDNGLHLHAQ